jgi:hypothetical protein
MTDEQRIGESSEQVETEENEDVEAHKRRHLNDEPAAEEDDEVEAHRRR